MYEGGKYAVNNPGEVVSAVGSAVKGEFNKLQNGSVREQGEVVGGILGVVAEVALGAKVAKGLTKVDDLASAASKGGFIVTEDGIAIHRNVNKLRTSLDNAGFKGIATTQTTESGTIHTLPNANGKGTFTTRIMDGKPGAGPYGGPRVINSRSNNGEYVRANGANFPNGSPKTVRKEGGHIHGLTN